MTKFHSLVENILSVCVRMNSTVAVNILYEEGQVVEVASDSEDVLGYLNSIDSFPTFSKGDNLNIVLEDSIATIYQLTDEAEMDLKAVYAWDTKKGFLQDMQIGLEGKPCDDHVFDAIFEVGSQDEIAPVKYIKTYELSTANHEIDDDLSELEAFADEVLGENVNATFYKISALGESGSEYDILLSSSVAPEKSEPVFEIHEFRGGEAIP